MVGSKLNACFPTSLAHWESGLARPSPRFYGSFSWNPVAALTGESEDVARLDTENQLAFCSNGLPIR